MVFSRQQVEQFQRNLAASAGEAPPVKNRARVGTGDLSQRKNWYAEMGRLPGVFIAIRLYSEANTRDKWATIERAKKHREDVAMWGKVYIRDFVGRNPLMVKLTRYGPKMLDTDNLARAFKAPRDEIAKMLGVDDGDTSRIVFQYEQVKTRVRHYGIRIEIEESK